MSIKAASPGAGLAVDLPEPICGGAALFGVPHSLLRPTAVGCAGQPNRAAKAPVQKKTIYLEM